MSHNALTEIDLIEIEQIKRLKARYFRAIDTKQWDELRDTFTDSAHFETLRGDFADPDTFVNTLAELFRDARTMHHGHMPEIVLFGPRHARGIWAMQDLVEWPRSPERSFTGTGHYEAKYEKAGVGWRIAFLRLTRVRFELISGAPSDHAEHFPHGAGSAWLIKD
jgi:hypothetical protein